VIEESGGTLEFDSSPEGTTATLRLSRDDAGTLRSTDATTDTDENRDDGDDVPESGLIVDSGIDPTLCESELVTTRASETE
jgi:hypothetical protein